MWNTADKGNLWVVRRFRGALGLQGSSGSRGASAEGRDPATAPAGVITRAELRRFQAGYRSEAGQLDLVVFSAPQLSLIEMQALARLLSGRQVNRPLLAVTSPQVKPDADRLGLTAAIEVAGGTVLAGMCFYQSYARELARANGWRHLATNSAKLANIIGGYDYQPVLLSMEAWVEAACRGRIG